MRWKHEDGVAAALPTLELDFEDRVMVEDVLDAAAAWQAGELPWTEAANIGGMLDWRGVVSQAYTRHVAYRVTPRTDPRHAALDALMAVIIRAQGYRVTRQGTFEPSEIRANDAGWQYANLDRSAA